ncbi:MAG: XRE family transcriptional regulator [Actinomycetota bacterium]|nr:XRE family transcriptional regulator [Actinomycetota bacterium]
MAADRARRFTAGLQSMSDESMELIYEDVRELACAYVTRPLPEIVGHLVSAQDTVFGLLERPQRPTHARRLHFLSAVLGGILGKASEDLADFPTALVQLRAAWLSAEQADHNGARAWLSGLQSLVSYRAHRPHDSIRYAQRGAGYAQRAENTATIRLPACEARAWATLGNAEAAREAIERAERAWEHVQPDELDDLGGLATFDRPRQLYYAADALSWVPAESAAADDYAHQAIAAYPDLAHPDCDYGGASVCRANLALARIARGEFEGAFDALTPVFELPADKRINGIIHSLNRVHRALTTVSSSASSAPARELQERIEDYTRTPMRALPR